MDGLLPLTFSPESSSLACPRQRRSWLGEAIPAGSRPLGMAATATIIRLADVPRTASYSGPCKFHGTPSLKSEILRLPLLPVLGCLFPTSNPTSGFPVRTHSLRPLFLFPHHPPLNYQSAVFSTLRSDRSLRSSVLKGNEFYTAPQGQSVPHLTPPFFRP